MELLKLGDDVLRRNYLYFEQLGNYRLAELQTGTPNDPTPLRDLRYTYEPVGNVTRINDVKNSEDVSFTTTPWTG